MAAARGERRGGDWLVIRGYPLSDNLVAYDFLGLIGLEIPERFYRSGLTVEVYRPFIRDTDLVPRPVEPGHSTTGDVSCTTPARSSDPPTTINTEGHPAPR